MSEDSALRAVHKHSERSVQNEGKATTTAFSEEQTCPKHHSALASWQQLEVSEQSLRCQPHMDVGQWKFGRENHLAEKTDRGQVFISKTKRTASVSTKKKIHLPNKWQRLWWRKEGENIRVFPSHCDKNKWTEAAWIKERRSLRYKWGSAEGIHPLIHWRSASLALRWVLRRCRMLGERKEGEREGRALGGVSSRAGVGGFALSQLSPSLTHRGGLKMAGEKVTAYSKIWTLSRSSKNNYNNIIYIWILF